MIKLGRRLTSLVDCIEGESVADIGTDHGKVVVHAVLTQKVKRAIAVDISAKSLQKARDLAESYGLELDFAVSDGLENLPYIPDSIIIAGLGGREIMSILNKNSLPKSVTFILMPHQDSWFLRKYLFEKDIAIKKDSVIKESGKYYDLIVTGEGEKYFEEEFFIGKNIPASPHYEEKLLARMKVLSSVLDSAKDKAADIIKEEAHALKSEFNKIEFKRKHNIGSSGAYDKN